jgi:hypothetical protein
MRASATSWSLAMHPCPGSYVLLFTLLPCYRCSCWSWSNSYGPATLGKIHDLLPQWMLDIKLANFNRTDGVSCSMVRRERIRTVT